MSNKEIEFAPGFTVNQTGMVIGPDGKQRPVYKNGDGYLGVSIKTKDGQWVTFGIQRLVALAFVKNHKPLLRTQVNHFDMDKENNHASNLDWVTDKENQMHAGLCDPRCLRKKLVVAGKQLHHNLGTFLVSTLVEAAAITQMSEKLVWEIIKGDATDPYWNITYLEYNSRLPENLKRLNNAKGAGVRRRIKVKDVLTGIITTYDSFRAAARDLDVIPTAVQHAMMRDDTLRSLQRRYLVVDENKPFPNVTADDLISNVRNVPKPVMAYHIEEKIWYVFGTVKEFIETSGLPTKLVRGRLSKSILTKDTGWVFMYKDNGSDAIVKIKEYLINEALVDGDVQIPSSQ